MVLVEKGKQKEKHYLAGTQIDKDVIQMTISQSNDVSNDGHDSTRPAKAEGWFPPLFRIGTSQPQFPIYNN